MPFPAKSLDRLARLVIGGDVVFFIGAGFSIDVEGNSATRLIERLLVRLVALTSPGLMPEATGRQFRTRFSDTFLTEKRTRDGIFPYDANDIWWLSIRYYEVNEWFVNTFAHLVSEAAKSSLGGKSPPFDPALAEKFVKRLSAEEAVIQKAVREHMPARPPARNCEDLEPLDSVLAAWAVAQPDDPVSGKAIFLDTLGFRDARVMGGRLQGKDAPWNHEPFESAEQNFRGKILPRHRVFARFAREGWCTTTITTNYDLLLEGAFRLAGFAAKNEAKKFPPTRFSRFARIASPVDFFTEGKALREPVLLKMHGCAERYRRWRYSDMDANAASREEFAAYLGSMVFTYREIQNWRGDSWAADFLRTQLRTRTVVFCGYSLQDPVIHDTFRTVYEEMASIRGPYEIVQEAVPRRDPCQAPAFFFAPKFDRHEFHGTEILRAASRAIGNSRAAIDGAHPNYVGFHLRGERFPDVDEELLWLYHRALRHCQAETLQNDLHRIATTWIGKPRPERDLAAVREGLARIAEHEAACAREWDRNPRRSDRRELERITAWSDVFHPFLLREFSCGDLVQQHGGPGIHLARLRRAGWYYPATENPYWTGWAAVVEVALRRMAAALHETDEAYWKPGLLTVAKCDRPTVLFAVPGQTTRRALTIHYGGFGLPSRQAPMAAVVSGRTFWELRPADARWTREAGLKTDEPKLRPLTPGSWSTPVPHPRYLWRWAAGRPTAEDAALAAKWIFGPHFS